MSNAHPIPRRKGRPAAVLALPPADAWPPPETLISRAALAELFGVNVPTFRGWERRAKGPPRAFAQGQEPRYRCREAREWLEREVRRQEAFERVSRLLSELAEEPVDELVEPEPADHTTFVPLFAERDDEPFADPFAAAGRRAPTQPRRYWTS
jgi:hypothetical protein